MLKTYILAALCACCMYGCSGTRYAENDKTNHEEYNFFQRQVNFRITDEFYQKPPDCVFIKPSSKVSAVIQGSIARELRSKIPHVIESQRVRRLSRYWALDIQHDADVITFSDLSKCGFMLDMTKAVSGSTYAIVWSRRRIGGSVNLLRVSDKKLLWSGYHVAERSGGGVPLSPVSIITESFSAGRFASDTDITASLADDWARRLFITLPSTVIYDDREPKRRSYFSRKEPKPWNKK